MGLSGGQRARQKQLANLRPGARTVQGPQSQTLLDPLRERHRAELLVDHPAIVSRRLTLLSDLLARIELVSSYLDHPELVKDRRTLEPRPLVKLLDQWQTKAWRMPSELIDPRTKTGAAVRARFVAERHRSRRERRCRPVENVEQSLCNRPLIGAAQRVRVAPKTIKAWHAAALISAVSVGWRGVAWLLDQQTFDREIASLPRGSYTGGCNRPVAEEGAACREHRLARRSRTRAKRPPGAHRQLRTDTAEVQRRRTMRSRRLGRARTRAPELGLARRKANDLEGLLRCASCAAKLTVQEKPLGDAGNDHVAGQPLERRQRARSRGAGSRSR